LVVSTVTLGSAAAQRPDNVGRDDHRQQIRQQAQARAQERRVSVDERKAEIKVRVAERKAEIQQRVCERRQATIERRIPRLATSANRIQIVIDTMYDRVAGFYESSQLTVDNYDELVEAIEVAKADSTAAVELVNDYQFEVDCEDQNLDQQLGEYRAAVGDARTELKTYRTALVDLISSLRAKAASDDQTDSDDESDQNQEEDTEVNDSDEETEEESETTTEDEGVQRDA